MTTVADAAATPAPAPATDVTGAKPSNESTVVTDQQILDAVAPLAWLGKSLVVRDRALIERRIRRKNLSASTHQSVSSCQAKFAIESVLPRVVNPLAANELGSGAHEVLERLYEKPPEKRTLRALRAQVRPVAVKALAALQGTPTYDEMFAEYTRTIGEWAEKILTLENPAEVQVYKTELQMKGLTLSNGVPFVGYLDRTRYEGDLDDWDNVKLLIDDYKFGAKVKRPDRFGDPYGDQMRLYKDAIFQEFGKEVTSARLLFPRQETIVPADLSPAATRATLAAFRRSYDLMNTVSDAAVFPAIPGGLCGWCPAANTCPVARVNKPNAKEAAATQHGGVNGPVALGIPTVREFVAPPRMNTADATEASDKEIPMTVVESSPKLHYPTNKWAAMNTASLTDAASAHLSIWDQPLKPVTIRALTRVLAGITRDIHEDVFMGGFDWSFDSASRVVYSLKESLKSRPAPFGEDAAAWEKWRKTLVGLTAAKLRIAVPLTDENEFGAPDFDALIVNTVTPARTRETEPVPAEPVPA